MSTVNVASPKYMSEIPFFNSPNRSEIQLICTEHSYFWTRNTINHKNSIQIVVGTWRLCSCTEWFQHWSGMEEMWKPCVWDLPVFHFFFFFQVYGHHSSSLPSSCCWELQYGAFQLLMTTSNDGRASSPVLGSILELKTLFSAALALLNRHDWFYWQSFSVKLPELSD